MTCPTEFTHIKNILLAYKYLASHSGCARRNLVRLHATCPLLLTDFNRYWNVSTNSRKIRGTTFCNNLFSDYHIATREETDRDGIANMLMLANLQKAPKGMGHAVA
jgi:hypothetical protein